MREGWENVKLGEVCELIKRGVAPKYIDEGGICVINQKCIRDHSINLKPARRHNLVAKAINPERCIRIADVLVNSTGTGTLGRVAQVRSKPEEPTTVDTHVTIVRPKLDMLYPDFFGYMLIKIEDEIADSGEGASGQTELARSRLENNFKVTYPTSIPEQKRIVAILDEAFAGITQAVTNAEKTLANSHELFESYLNNIFTQRGTGWNRTTIGGLCKKVEYGSSLKSKPEGKVPVLRMGNIQNGRINWNKLVYTDNSKEISKYLLKKNDVLFNRTNSAELVGKTAIYDGERPAIFAGYLIRIHRKKDLINADFLNFYLNSISAKEYGKIVMSRSINQANINGTKLKQYPISIPALNTQKKIVEGLHSLRIETQHLESIYQKKLTALAELKQSILQKAFAGELTSDVVYQQVVNG